jgi:hypothetical protein
MKKRKNLIFEIWFVSLNDLLHAPLRPLHPVKGTLQPKKSRRSNKQDETQDGDDDGENRETGHGDSDRSGL